MQRLVDALAAQESPVPFEAVIAVDGSTDGTAALLGARPRDSLALRWEDAPNAGRAAALNRGIALARGRLLILLDDDMVPPPGFVAAHLAEHPKGEPARFVMGAAPIRPVRGAGPFLRYMTATRNEHYARLAEPGRDLHVRDLYSGNASVPRAALLAVGGSTSASGATAARTSTSRCA